MIIRENDAEIIFSMAVALEQSGRNKNMIFGKGQIIYVLNSDKTILLRFQTQKDTFQTPISFYSSDYDSPNFKMVGEQVVFTQTKAGFERNKSVNIPSQTFDEIEKKFNCFNSESDIQNCIVTIRKEMLELLDDSLSHIEFMVKDKQFRILQRDIFSGAIIELKKEEEKGLGLINLDDVFNQDIIPMGMRTNDFFALFSFNDEIQIRFRKDRFLINGDCNSMCGVIGACLYDDLGTIKHIEEENNGGKIEANQCSESEINREITPKKKLCKRKIKEVGQSLR